LQHVLPELLSDASKWESINIVQELVRCFTSEPVAVDTEHAPYLFGVFLAGVISRQCTAQETLWKSKQGSQLVTDLQSTESYSDSATPGTQLRYVHMFSPNLSPGQTPPISGDSFNRGMEFDIASWEFGNISAFGSSSPLQQDISFINCNFQGAL
jgi:hypothetical protein